MYEDDDDAEVEEGEEDARGIEEEAPDSGMARVEEASEAPSEVPLVQTDATVMAAG